MDKLNETVKAILMDYHDLCVNNHWNDKEKETRATYDTRRIQNLLK